MYQNRVTLIGFLGKDAEVVSFDNGSRITNLSLATKESWKDKQTGEWQSHTEWHRGVVNGKLGEFAATLRKGAHIQIEGQLRSRQKTNEATGEINTYWHIRVNSILKLDRAERADHNESANEDAAEPEYQAAY